MRSILSRRTLRVGFFPLRHRAGHPCLNVPTVAETGFPLRVGRRIRKAGIQHPFRRLAAARLRLFFQSGNVPRRKLPTTIALDQCICELHDSIEWFAVRCSFHARFA